MAADSKHKSETSASHPRRETRTRTSTAKPSRAMDAAPAKHGSADLSTEREAQSAEANSPTEAHDVVDRLHEAKVYLREHDIDEVIRDAVAVVRNNPVVAMLVIGGVVLGGAAIVAGLQQGDPRTHETLGRMRQAAVSFALAKVIDSIDSNFPGFREHFERSQESATRS